MTNLTTRLIYSLDALGSLAFGIVFSAFAGPLAALLGPAIAPAAILTVGIALVPWAAFNLWIGRRGPFPRGAATLNVIGDAVCIAACAALLLFVPLTSVGMLAVAATIAFMLVVCLVKFAGIRQSPQLA